MNNMVDKRVYCVGADKDDVVGKYILETYTGGKLFINKTLRTESVGEMYRMFFTRNGKLLEKPKYKKPHEIVFRFNGRIELDWQDVRYINMLSNIAHVHILSDIVIVWGVFSDNVSVYDDENYESKFISGQKEINKPKGIIENMYSVGAYISMDDEKSLISESRLILNDMSKIDKVIKSVKSLAMTDILRVYDSLNFKVHVYNLTLDYNMFNMYMTSEPTNIKIINDIEYEIHTKLLF